MPDAAGFMDSDCRSGGAQVDEMIGSRAARIVGLVAHYPRAFLPGEPWAEGSQAGSRRPWGGCPAIGLLASWATARAA